ncbi:unnamed protein product [Somion occarium]|uniref:Uncharacterized protein n=1 Tax=Somion occarium TaxID=3059160 RepID=A0ABP1CQR9_9APHY
MMETTPSLSFSSLPLSDVLFPFADGGLEGEEERVRKEVDDADDVADPVVEEDEDAMALDLNQSIPVMYLMGRDHVYLWINSEAHEFGLYYTSAYRVPGPAHVQGSSKYDCLMLWFLAKELRRKRSRPVNLGEAERLREKRIAENTDHKPTRTILVARLPDVHCTPYGRAHINAQMLKAD